MQKALANQLLVLAFLLALNLGLPLRLAVFLLAVTAGVAVLSNVGGGALAGLALVASALGLSLAVYAPNLAIWLVLGVLLLAAGLHGFAPRHPPR